MGQTTSVEWGVSLYVFRYTKFLVDRVPESYFLLNRTLLRPGQNRALFGDGELKGYCSAKAGRGSIGDQYRRV
jgi:hypothetical protein